MSSSISALIYVLHLLRLLTITVLYLVSDDTVEESLSNLGSPGDLNLAPVAWSVSGKYLAAAMEKVVNIWQVNGGSPMLITLLNDSLNNSAMFRSLCCVFTDKVGKPRWICNPIGYQH